MEPGLGSEAKIRRTRVFYGNFSVYDWMLKEHLPMDQIYLDQTLVKVAKLLFSCLFTPLFGVREIGSRLEPNQHRALVLKE